MISVFVSAGRYCVFHKRFMLLKALNWKDLCHCLVQWFSPRLRIDHLEQGVGSVEQDPLGCRNSGPGISLKLPSDSRLQTWSKTLILPNLSITNGESETQINS